MPAPPEPGRWRGPLVGLAIAAAFACAFSVVRPTNFAGFDEWLFLWLASHGVLDSPYSNRPLNFVWTTPGAWLVPHSFAGFHVLHVAYLLGAALLLAAVVRRSAPGSERMAAVSALIACTFVPADMARLSTVQMTVVSGSTFGVLLSVLGLVAASSRRSPVLLAAATLVAFVTVRSYEATLGVLAAAPLLLFAGGRERRPPGWILLGWGAGLAAAGFLTVWPHVRGGPDVAYQASVFQLDLELGHVIRRFAHRFEWHLLPLLRPQPASLLAPTVVAAAVLGILAVVSAASAAGDRTGRASARSRAVLAGAALVLTAAAYLPFTLSARLDEPSRAQMAASPWVGLGLALALDAATLRLAGRTRSLVVAAATGWIVLVGAGRTVAMQEAWDQQTFYGRQRQSLVDLVRLAPALEAHTLVVAVGGQRVWPSVFGFRHAVQYVYRDQASGYALGALELMYPTRRTPEGVRTDTWPVVRGPWGVEPTLHRYDEIVVVAVDEDGGLTLVAGWPERLLGPLPPGARYAPHERIRREAGRVPERRILGSSAAG